MVILRTFKVMLGYKNRKQFLQTYAIILALIVFGTIARWINFSEYGIRFHTFLFLSAIALTIVFWEALRLVNNWLNRKYPFEHNLTGRIVLQLAIGAFIGLFIRLLVYKWAEPLLPFKLDRMFAVVTWPLYAIMTAGVNLGFFTAYFIRRWKDSIVKAERLEKEKSQVQFDNLKNQLNPHFLFNALTSLNSLIFEDQQLASAFLQQLSKVYRYVLQNKHKNFVLLATELDFIAHYVMLLETRFQGALKINFKITDDTKEKAIVPVTLQILIENAIKHNIADKERKLTIDVLTVGDYLVVSNNLQLRKTVETSNKQGLDNLRSLYKFLTDKPVLVEPTDDRFYVKIPLI
jgi:two-component system, LytTR family, sensor kinase